MGIRQYLTLHGTIVVKKDNETIFSLNDLKGKKVAVLKGDVAEEYLIREKLNNNLVLTNTFEIALQELNNGKVDAVVVQELVALQLIKKLNLSNLEIRKKLIKLKANYCFAVTEGDKQLLADLNEGLSIIIADGTYEQLHQKWLGILEPDNTRLHLTITVIASIAILFVTLIIARVWKSSLRRQVKVSTKQLEFYKRDLEKLVSRRTVELEEEKFKLNQAQEITHIGSYRWKLKGNKTSWSDELFRIAGYAPQEFEPTYEKYLNCIHPDDKEIFDKLTQEAINNKSTYSSEYRILQPNNEVRFVYEKGEVSLDDENNMDALVGVIQDITELKQADAEKIRMQQELLQSQKMDSLGQLTGGIAHDFNNLLGIINGFADLAHATIQSKPDKKLSRYLENIRTAGTRAATLVAQMLSFSRGDQVENTPIHFSQLVSDEVNMLRSTLPSTIRINKFIEPDLPKIMMNPTQLHQVIMNLSINARDAMDGEGELTIRLGWARALDTQSTVSHKPIHGDWIELSISDTGPGIDIESENYIFNPFYTTKEVGKGTGMGLAVVYRIMDNHEGHIILENNSNTGCVFRMLFSPISEDDFKNSQLTQEDIDTPMGDNSEILIVDDEPLLCEQIADTVKEYGYQPTSVNDSAQALALFKQEPDRFSVLITDQTMPKMTGTELVAKIREIKPELPIIMCSGYSNKIGDKGAEELNIAYFDKPVKLEKLLFKIAELLGLN